MSHLRARPLDVGRLPLAAFAVMVALVTLGALPHADAQRASPVRIDRDVEARMRDGVILRADVYRPDTEGRFPALLQRTPYSKNPGSADNQFTRMADAGYVVIVQDTRGRYMSDGVARAHDEGQDGYDTVEWAARLPYVNGKVGMFGGSYSATTQLLTAPLRPPSLVALFPSASYASRYDMVFQGGAFYLYDGLSWNLGQGADVRRRRESPEVRREAAIGMTADERRMFRDHWLWHLPLKTMNAMRVREFSPAYFDMLEHPSYNAFWETFDVAAKHADFEVPAYHLTGWYDTLLNGTIANFTGLRAHARTEHARRHQRLIVGPWTHARPSAGTTSIGGVEYGPDAGFDSAALLVEWFDYWLKDGSDAVLSRAPVRIFVMGENRWRDEQEWPLARARDTAYYLHSGGRANTREGDGTLGTAPPQDQPPDRYVYDPWNPVPTGDTGVYSRVPADRRDVQMRQDVLVYTSAPLTEALEVTGPITLHLWADSSARDTDFTATLVDVLPDGTARALTDGILRARYRHSKTTPELLEPGRAEAFRIDLGATSNVFLPGHRIRLEVSSSNFPRFDRNPNTGGVFAEDTELRRATQTVHHTAARPSRLVLPVVPR